MHYGIAFTTTAKRRYLTFWNSLCVGKAATWFWDRAIVSLAASDTRWARLRLSLKFNLEKKRKEKPHWFFCSYCCFGGLMWQTVHKICLPMINFPLKSCSNECDSWQIWLITSVNVSLSFLICDLKFIGLQNGSQLTSFSSNFYSNLVCFACDTVWGYAPH